MYSIISINYIIMEGFILLLYEIKRGCFNKGMLLSICLTLICLIAGGYEPLFLYGNTVDFTYTYYFARSCGTASILSLVYPLIACIPYANTFWEEKQSGYLNYNRIKIKPNTYKLSKIISCIVSGGISIALPTLVYFIICLMLKGTETNNSLDGYITHSVKFYMVHPILYCLTSAFNTFICGAIFALIGLAISTIVKNKYLVSLLPFCIFIFMCIFFAEINLHLNPILLFDINSYAESKYFYVFLYKLIIMLISFIIFWNGAFRDEE